MKMTCGSSTSIGGNRCEGLCVRFIRYVGLATLLSRLISPSNSLKTLFMVPYAFAIVTSSTITIVE